MRLIAITTCTNRKRFPVPTELKASDLPQASLATIAAQWRQKVDAAGSCARAIDVYCGRSFREAQLAAKAGDADLRIISGGLGLVRGDEAIPSYSLSLVQ